MRIPSLIFPRQDCPAGQLYYVCATPVFRGCCSNDPCGSSCRDGTGSGTGTSSAVSPTFATPTTISSATTRSTSPTGGVRSTSTSSPSSTRSIVSEPSQTAPNSATDTPTTSHKSSTSTGLIAGLIILGVIILILIAFLIFRRQRRHRSSSSPTPPSKRVSSLFSRLSATSPLLSKHSSTHSPSVLKSPPPAYDDKDATPVLDSTPIHELPSSTPRSPSELLASLPARAVRSEPGGRHVLAFAERGAESDEVGALAANLAGRGGAPSALRDSWASTWAVVDGDGLGIRSR